MVLLTFFSRKLSPLRFLIPDRELGKGLMILIEDHIAIVFVKKKFRLPKKGCLTPRVLKSNITKNPWWRGGYPPSPIRTILTENGSYDCSYYMKVTIYVACKNFEERSVVDKHNNKDSA